MVDAIGNASARAASASLRACSTRTCRANTSTGSSRKAGNRVLSDAAYMERALLLAAGLLFVYPRAWFDAAGMALLGAALVIQIARRRRRSGST